VTSMSPKALFYSKEEFKHRHLVIAEAEGMEKAEYAIRSILSEGKLRHIVVENGVSRPVEKEGPMGLIITTTKIKVHSENETRMLTVFILDTPEQTRKVLMAMASESAKDFDYTAWHEFQKHLETCDNRVTIPFATALVALIPPLSVRLRRDVQQVLSLIKTHAILHQQNRERDEQGRIVATLDDYAAIYRLVADLISQGIEATVSDKMRETVEAVKTLTARHMGGVSYKAVSVFLGLDKSSAKRRCDDAIDRDYIRKNQTRKNQPAQLVMGEPMPDDTTILPTPETLQALFPEDTDSGCKVAREHDNDDNEAHIVPQQANNQF